MCFFQTTTQFLDTSWGYYNSTQLWHCLPGDIIRPYRLRAQSCSTAPPPPHPKTPVASPDRHLCFWHTSCRAKVPTTPSLVFPEQLTELIEIFYFLDYWFIFKGYHSGIVRWEDTHRARYVERGTELPCFFRMHHSLRASSYSRAWSSLSLALLCVCFSEVLFVYF